MRTSNLPLIILLFIATYFISSVSVLFTESSVLFISFFLVFILVIGNVNLKLGVSKEEFRYEETVRFLILMKNWNRALIRLTDIKIYNFLLLAQALQQYEGNWLRRVLPAYTRYERAQARKYIRLHIAKKPRLVLPTIGNDVEETVS